MIEIREEINHKGDICQHLLEYIEKEDATEKDFQSLKDFINHQNIRKDKTELSQFLHMVSKISKHHQRTPGFIDKIKAIIFDFKTDIKNTFKNIQIYDFFKNDKPILLYLLQEGLITVTQELSILLQLKHSQFFYPEIKPFLSNEVQSKLESEILEYSEHFDQLRQEGENPSYICELIRNDSVEEFISYINRYQISVSSTIKPSFFETHLIFLKESKITLIEYAAFYGSFQIVQYLLTEGAKFTNLWLYSIHGRNAEIIDLLETKGIEPNDNTYEECFSEAIKCFHNDVAEYILNNLLENESIQNLKDETKRAIGKSDNYLFYPIENIDYNYILMCYNEKLVELSLKIDKCEFPESYYFDHNSRNLVFSPTASVISGSPFRYEYLLHVKIPPSVKIIHRGAFHGSAFPRNSGFEQIKIPSTEIRSFAFCNCRKLKIVFISSTVESIGYYAFCGCKLLELVVFDSPSSLKIIHENAFSYCDSLKRITIPSSVTIIRENAFENCLSLTEVIFESPSSLFTIPPYTFNKSKLTKIKIPSSLKKIGFRAFSESNLSQIEFEDNSKLKFIGDFAFSDAVKLEKIKIPASVIKIRPSAFFNCCALNEVVFESPSSLISLADFAFSLCKSLKAISFPSSLEKIGPCAFKGCSKLENISFESPSFLYSIGNQAFENCVNLKYVSIPSSVKIIGCNAFEKCSSLKKAEIPSSLNKIRLVFPSHTEVIKRDI